MPLPAERDNLGRYTLGRILGEGGAGRVHEAVLRGPGGFRKPVALKILHTGAEELRREARLTGLLRHPNLVDVYEIGEADGVWFCALELCTGGTLAAHTPLPPRAAVEVALQVCAALQYAHEELGLIHLDLKPQNLLIAEDGTIKVADLGIARAQGFSDRCRVQGTPGYMAPEQERGLHLDARADIYALGVTMLELFVGARPVAGGTMDVDSLDPPVSTLDRSETMHIEELTGEPAAQRSCVFEFAGVPKAVEPIIARCVAEYVEDRWPDMASLGAALNAVEVGGPGLREALDLEQPSELAHSTTNLTALCDAFVGRDAELATLVQALDGPCLVTLKGPAGVGKTRLAMTAAARWHETTGSQAWFCDLSGAHSQSDLLHHVAATLRVPLAQGDHQALANQLGHAIAARGPCALVLDNFEQIADLAPVIQGWRKRASEARLVVTSRVPLHLPSEAVLSVEPLSFDAGMALVVARAAERGAQVATDPNLAELVTRLDGLPLALELAAGRLGVLSVADVLERLGLAMLRRGTSDRHGTLSAALDWSWELLEATERTALAQLSVFSGGFTIEAAEAVLDLGGRSVLDTVSALVDRSMVSSSSGSRFRLLSSVQEYAKGKLEGLDTEVRHGRHFARSGTGEAIDALHRHGGQARRDVLIAEIDNITEACRRAVTRGDGETATQTLAAAWEVLELRGPFEAGASLAEQVLTLNTLDPLEGASAATIAAEINNRCGRTQQAIPLLHRALAAARASGDPRQVGKSLTQLSRVEMDQGERDSANQHLDEAIASFREVRDRLGQGIIQGRRGLFHFRQGRIDQARADYQEALEIHRELGNRRFEAIVAGNLGVLMAQLGAMEEARGHHEAALAAYREVGDRRGEAVALGSLAGWCRGQGLREQAHAHHKEACEIHREVGNRRYEAIELGNIGVHLFEQGQLDRARAHYKQALEVHREIGNQRSECLVMSWLGMLARREGKRDEARRWHEQSLDLALAIGNRLLEGMAVGELGDLDRDSGDNASARTRLESALSIARQVGHTHFEATVQADLARVLAVDGDIAAALELVETSRTTFEELGDIAAISKTWACRAEVLWRGEDRSAARDALARALETAPADHDVLATVLDEVRALMSS